MGIEYVWSEHESQKCAFWLPAICVMQAGERERESLSFQLKRVAANPPLTLSLCFPTGGATWWLWDATTTQKSSPAHSAGRCLMRVAFLKKRAPSFAPSVTTCATPPIAPSARRRLQGWVQVKRGLQGSRLHPQVCWKLGTFRKAWLTLNPLAVPDLQFPSFQFFNWSC